ncbi:MAG: gliding motility lipoprotein GldH [Bacteroidales bacterium]|nr:gliding motility lipoprotein GldH [Bacteroidales bacterium]
MSRRFVFLLFVSAFFVACDRSAVFDQSVIIPNEEWNKDSLAVFTIPVTDTIVAYNLFVNIRNNEDYQFQNFYLFIDIHAPNGAFIRDTFECYLADDHGKWFGKGRGRIYDNRFLYRRSVKFSTRGDYRVQLQQAMRVDNLKGLVNVGVRMEREGASQ